MISARPHKAKIVCYVAAAALVSVFAVVSLGLRGQSEGVAVFSVGDQVAMMVLGLLGALGILWFTRPRVDADAAGIKVRNLVGGYELPWAVVREIRFDRGAPWATLELVDDEVISLMAVQAADKERAVVAVRGLRALHREALVG